MADQVYLCRTCKAVKISSSPPSPMGCACGAHKWFAVGPAGEERHHCDKCGVSVGLAAGVTPEAKACPGGEQHEWQKV